MTSYTVLHTDVNGNWQPLAETVEANWPKAAITAAVEEMSEAAAPEEALPDAWVAIPVRHWKPETVTVVNVREVVVGETKKKAKVKDAAAKADAGGSSASASTPG